MGKDGIIDDRKATIINDEWLDTNGLFLTKQLLSLEEMLDLVKLAYLQGYKKE